MIHFFQREGTNLKNRVYVKDEFGVEEYEQVQQENDNFGVSNYEV